MSPRDDGRGSLGDVLGRENSSFFPPILLLLTLTLALTLPASSSASLISTKHGLTSFHCFDYCQLIHFLVLLRGYPRFTTVIPTTIIIISSSKKESWSGLPSFLFFLQRVLSHQSTVTMAAAAAQDDDYNSSDIEVPEAQNPYAHLGRASIISMLANAGEERAESKIKSKQLVDSTGAPGTRQIRASWVNRFKDFAQGVLRHG